MTELDPEKAAEAVWAEQIAEAVYRHMQAGTFARPLLSVPQMGEQLGVSESTAWKLVRGEEPKIASFMVEGQRRVDPREVDRYLEAQKEQAA